jgi:hypothetical protein
MARQNQTIQDYLKALLMLFKEYEILRSGADSSSRSRMVVASRRLFRPKVRPDNGDLKKRPSLTSLTLPGTSTDFTYLAVYHVPFVPDLQQTFLCLCEAVIGAYKHIQESLVDDWQSVGQDVHDLLIKVDDRIYKNIVAPSLREVDSQFRNLTYYDNPSATSKLSSLLSRA